ncbi:ABC transporter ATP-binding protein [Limosilactobacillus fermentum]|nr:ABC transporter ATP-binding protein [Limosilactobacillus fermentum]
MVNTILKEADLFCPNSVRINFTIYHLNYTLTPLITFTISNIITLILLSMDI